MSTIGAWSCLPASSAFLPASLPSASFIAPSPPAAGRARAWLALAGAATGCGIWATHFIAMLAYEPGVPDRLRHRVDRTFSGPGSRHHLPRPERRRAEPIYVGSPMLGGAIVGGGVAAMHYTGMSALKLPGHITWSPELVAASIVLGILLGSIALVVAVRRDDRRGVWLPRSSSRWRSSRIISPRWGRSRSFPIRPG